MPRTNGCEDDEDPEGTYSVKSGSSTTASTASSSVKMPEGLCNRGNTCFLNASMQVFRGCPTIRTTLHAIAGHRRSTGSLLDCVAQSTAAAAAAAANLEHLDDPRGYVEESNGDVEAHERLSTLTLGSSLTLCSSDNDKGTCSSRTTEQTTTQNRCWTRDESGGGLGFETAMWRYYSSSRDGGGGELQGGVVRRGGKIVGDNDADDDSLPTLTQLLLLESPLSSSPSSTVERRRPGENPKKLKEIGKRKIKASRKKGSSSAAWLPEMVTKKMTHSANTPNCHHHAMSIRGLLDGHQHDAFEAFLLLLHLLSEENEETVSYPYDATAAATVLSSSDTQKLLCNDGRDGDAAMLARFIRDQLERRIPPSSSSKNGYVGTGGGGGGGFSSSSMVQDAFRGVLKTVVVCETCGKRTVTFDPFLSLSLDLNYHRQHQQDVTTGDGIPSSCDDDDEEDVAKAKGKKKKSSAHRHDAIQGNSLNSSSSSSLSLSTMLQEQYLLPVSGSRCEMKEQWRRRRQEERRRREVISSGRRIEIFDSMDTLSSHHHGKTTTKKQKKQTSGVTGGHQCARNTGDDDGDRKRKPKRTILPNSERIEGFKCSSCCRSQQNDSEGAREGNRRLKKQDAAAATAQKNTNKNNRVNNTRQAPTTTTIGTTTTAVFKATVVATLPPILVVQLRRFDALGRKLTSLVSLPETLYLQLPATPPSSSSCDCEYALVATVSHEGGTLDEGHYTSHLRVDNPRQVLRLERGHLRSKAGAGSRRRQKKNEPSSPPPPPLVAQFERRLTASPRSPSSLSSCSDEEVSEGQFDDLEEVEEEEDEYSTTGRLDPCCWVCCDDEDVSAVGSDGGEPKEEILKDPDMYFALYVRRPR